MGLFDDEYKLSRDFKDKYEEKYEEHLEAIKDRFDGDESEWSQDEVMRLLPHSSLDLEDAKTIFKKVNGIDLDKPVDATDEEERHIFEKHAAFLWTVYEEFEDYYNGVVNSDEEADGSDEDQPSKQQKTQTCLRCGEEVGL